MTSHRPAADSVESLQLQASFISVVVDVAAVVIGLALCLGVLSLDWHTVNEGILEFRTAGSTVLAPPPSPADPVVSGHGAGQ